MSVLSSIDCLPSVFEYLSLVDASVLGSVCRHWGVVSQVCPRTVVDTVGFNIDPNQVVSMLLSSRRTVRTVRISAYDVEALLEAVLPILPELSNLENLAIFSAQKDGSVFCNGGGLKMIESYQRPGRRSLILSCDPSLPVINKLLTSWGKSLSSIAFLQGTFAIFKSEKDVVNFLDSKIDIAKLECLHLGHCKCSLDLDPVIAKLLAQAGQLKYIQWSDAGASLEMMRALMTSERKIKCAFEGAGFLSSFFRTA